MAKGILTKSSMHTGVMRGRDVREQLMSVDLHPKAKEILEKIAEINHTNTLAVAELATMFDQMIDNMKGVMTIAENMKDRTDRMREAMEGPEDETSVN